jgi:spectinomycin phosphotransferase
MLVKPDLADELLVDCLSAKYGLAASNLTFLPLGADVNTAVYRARAAGGMDYFVKLRRADFTEIAVTLPHYLSQQGITQIISALAAQDGQLWTEMAGYHLILYPFIEGRDASEVILSESQWADFGNALQKIHCLLLPETLLSQVPRETYPAHGRQAVRRVLLSEQKGFVDDPVARRFLASMNENRRLILDLVERAAKLAERLQGQPPPPVLCHSDAHAWNLLIDRSGKVYLVDWDNPILAPKERDLMFIGAGLGFAGQTPESELILFYRGYGETQINPFALAYYRYERIVQDIAAYSEQLLASVAGGEDREQSYQYFLSNFLPGGTIDLAYRQDQTRLFEAGQVGIG